jgi:hypothetical protein
LCTVSKDLKPLKKIIMKNNFKRFLKALRRPKYIHPDFVYPVAMVEVDEKAGSFNGCLGISDDRAKYLLELLHTRMIKREAPHLMILEVSKECKHPNELAFVAHHCGECPAMRPNPIMEFLNRRS